MKKAFVPAALFALSLLVASPAADAQAFVDVEGGPVFTGYNDVRIPAETGSRISLADDVASDPALALRIRLGYVYSGRHTVSLLAAPLTVRGSGTIDRNLSYQGKTFAAGTEVDSVYRFDSYRTTYRYTFVKDDGLELGAGLTAKIRSADIALMSDSAYAHRGNLGVVPLVNFRMQWNFLEPFSLLLEADALASPFGRAEDALIALQHHPQKNVALRLGYRILEGGSDGGGDVYTFALFHYLTAGVSVSF